MPIIDGVDVAECIYYNAEKLANCGMFALGDFKCQGQICLYKQLKRLEQENNLLKQTLKDKNFVSIVEENKKLLHTLQEIKEIAENREIFCENCSFCCDEFTCDDCGYVKILQKITKAEEE